MSGGENSGEASQDATASNNGTKPVGDQSIYENRGPKKIIRLITVMAYVFSVSFVAIVLSAYYLFLWEPPNPRLLHTSRYSGEPGVQYLQAHPSFELTGSHDDNYPGHFVIKANHRLAKLQGALASAPVNPRLSDAADSALEKSLSVLRNSIVDVLRGYQNSSTNLLYVSSKNMSDTKSMTKLSVNSDTTTFKTIDFPTNTKNSTLNNPKTPAIAISAIISGSEKTVDSTTNRSALRAYGQDEEIIATRLQNPLNQLWKNNVSLKSHAEEFSSNGTVKREPPTIPAADDPTTVKSLMTFGKKEDEHFPAESIEYANIDHDWNSSEKQFRSHPTVSEDRFAERSILSSRDSRFNVSVKSLKEAAMHSTQRSQHATIVGETQLENIMMKASLVDSDEEISENTTPQQKGLLALLIESADTVKVSSSTVMAARTTSSPSTEDNTFQNSGG